MSWRRRHALMAAGAGGSLRVTGWLQITHMGKLFDLWIVLAAMLRQREALARHSAWVGPVQQHLAQHHADERSAERCDAGVALQRAWCCR